jgi:hypothetical protein
VFDYRDRGQPTRRSLTCDCLLGKANSVTTASAIKVGALQRIRKLPKVQGYLAAEYIVEKGCWVMVADHGSGRLVTAPYMFPWIAASQDGCEDSLERAHDFAVDRYEAAAESYNQAVENGWASGANALGVSQAESIAKTIGRSRCVESDGSARFTVPVAKLGINTYATLVRLTGMCT